MKSLAVATLVGLLAGPLGLHAQQSGPAAGMTLRLQLVQADTAIKTRDTLVARLDNPSAASVWCARTEGGKPRGPGSACGPRVQGMALVEERRVVTDAMGHAAQRFTWPGGEATVEIDATDLQPAARGTTVHLKTSFWPKVANGDVVESRGAVSASATVPVGHLIAVTVYSERGAMILSIRPEAVK